MNRFHRWYCRSGRWESRLRDSVLPWVLGDRDLGDDVLEVGPGPGLTTRLLRSRVAALTALEVDHRLAEALREKMRGTNVTVVEGDGTAMPFEDGRFSAAVCFTTLHHVPSEEEQDRLLSEVRRVLRPGGGFLGSDSTPDLVFRFAHLFDTMVPVDPDTFGERLESAGFCDVTVSRGRGAMRFRARRPS